MYRCQCQAISIIHQRCHLRSHSFIDVYINIIEIIVIRFCFHFAFACGFVLKFYFIETMAKCRANNLALLCANHIWIIEKRRKKSLRRNILHLSTFHIKIRVMFMFFISALFFSTTFSSCQFIYLRAKWNKKNYFKLNFGFIPKSVKKFKSCTKPNISMGEICCKICLLLVLVISNVEMIKYLRVLKDLILSGF